MGKKNLKDKNSLYDIIKDITRDLNSKSVSDVKSSYIVKPLLEKLDLEDEYKLLETLSSVSSITPVKTGKSESKLNFNFFKI